MLFEFSKKLDLEVELAPSMCMLFSLRLPIWEWFSLVNSVAEGKNK